MAEQNGTTALMDPAYEVEEESSYESDSTRWPSQDKEYLCECAREHWVVSEEAEAEWRERALDDQRFAHGEQWHQALLDARKNRQCLVIDRAGTPMRQIINEGRQNRLSILVSPAGNGATMDTAKTIKGLVRNIEQQSTSDIAYTTSRTNAVVLGRGYVRVAPVYVDDFSFQQELRIFPVRNPFSIRLDPRHVMPDASDANWFFVVERVSRKQYEQENGELPAEAAAWVSTGDSWLTQDEVQVAEYWWREWHKLDLAQLQSGEIKPVNRLSRVEKTQIAERRTARIPQVWMAKINGYQVLHQTRWQGRFLPIAQHVGEAWDLEGKVDYQGLTRRLKDPQRQYNYWESAKAEMIALAPKAPFIGAAEQFEGYQQFWKTANTEPHAYLPYHPHVVGGQALPPPQRSNVEPPVQAMVEGAQLAADEIRAISGYHEPSLGEPGNERSAAAITRRQQQGNTASYHYGDNERWCIRHIGRILVDAIPFYYKGERVERILGDDDRPQEVTLNKKHVDPNTGQEVLYDVTSGRYDVAIDAGPSFQTKRTEAVEKLGVLLSAAPQLLQIIGDDYLESIDVDMSEHMAERMRKSMPPALLQGEPGAEKYLAAQQQLQQLQQMPILQQKVQQQEAQIAQMHEAVKSLSEANQMLSLEVANKKQQLEIDAQKLQMDAADKEQQRQIDALKAEIDAYKAETERLKVAATTREQNVEGGPYA